MTEDEATAILAELIDQAGSPREEAAWSRIRSTIESKDAEIERLTAHHKEAEAIRSQEEGTKLVWYSKRVEEVVAERDTLQRESTRLESQAQGLLAKNGILQQRVNEKVAENDQLRDDLHWSQRRVNELEGALERIAGQTPMQEGRGSEQLYGILATARQALKNTEKEQV